MHPVWRKRWINIGWVTLGAVTLVLLVAGVYKKNHKLCTGVEVVFDGDGNNFFIDEKGVAAVLKANGVEPGLEMGKIDLRSLEGKLKNGQWIANADLFFDNRQVLKALIQEKEPVARLFTAAGSSFYIDSACRRLPLSQKLSARIPMFTGFPSDRELLSKPDSALLASVKELAMFIQTDEFWKAQVAQIDITPDGFEMIPTVGSHLVILGKENNYQEKFDRLFSFYKQVWTKVGFEAYEKLDVRFDGQVVATVKGAKSKAVIDSAKAIAAMEDMLAKDKPDTVDEDATPVDVPVAKNTQVARKPVMNKPMANAKPTIAKPVAVMAKQVSAKKILPNAIVNKATLPRHPSQQSLTDEEEKIRREAINKMKAPTKAKVKRQNLKVKNL